MLIVLVEFRIFFNKYIAKNYLIMKIDLLSEPKAKPIFLARKAKKGNKDFEFGFIKLAYDLTLIFNFTDELLEILFS